VLTPLVIIFQKGNPYRFTSSCNQTKEMIEKSKITRKRNLEIRSIKRQMIEDGEIFKANAML
jgi:hypothetical protein